MRMTRKSLTDKERPQDFNLLALAAGLLAHDCNLDSQISYLNPKAKRRRPLAQAQATSLDRRRDRGHHAGRRWRPPVTGDLLMGFPPGCEILQKLNLARRFNRRVFGSANSVYRQFRAFPL